MIKFTEILLEQEVLIEAVDYHSLFNPIYKIFSGTGEPEKRIKNSVEKYIKQYKSKFKKSDIILYLLKLIRTSLINQLEHEFQKEKVKRLYVNGFDVIDLESEEQFLKLKEIFYQYYKKEESKLDKTLSVSVVNNIVNEFEHFLSLPIDNIKNYQFKNQKYSDIIGEFKNYEREWKKSKEELISYDSDDNVIIELSNNFYWVSLDKAYCSKEGKSMGHCGNSPRSGTDDNIYSLRQLKSVGKEKYWHPFVTVTVDDEGYVWEVKGRGNDKPAKRYIPYVVELFKNKKYISGQRDNVGYLPENNLNFERDFTEEQKEEILSSNPKFEFVEREPIRLELYNDDLADYIFNEDFDTPRYANRYPESDEEWDELFSSTPNIEIDRYDKVLDSALEYYQYGKNDRQEKLEKFIQYFDDFYENRTEDKEIIVKSVNDLFREEQDNYMDYLLNEIESEIEKYIEKTFEGFDWNEDNLDKEDYEELVDTINQNFDYDIEHYSEDAELTVEFLKELADSNIPVDEDLLFYDMPDDFDEMVLRMIKNIVRTKKGREEEFEEPDPNQLEFDFDKDVNESWRKLIKDIL
jgi:hypothetical protein